MTGGSAPSPSLRQSAAAGVRWTAASAGATLIFGTVQIAVLARLIPPAELGLAAAVTLVVGMAQVFTDIGLSGSIIAKQTTDRSVLSSLYWLNVAAGVVSFATLVALSSPIASMFGEPELGGLIAVAAVAFVVAPAGQQFQAILQRDLRFRVLAAIDIASKLLGVAVAIATAAAGLGALAVVLGVLATAAARAALLASWGWRAFRPQLRLRPAEVRSHLSFGGFQVGERVVNYASANVDYLLIAAYLGPGALGLYFLAYQTIIKPLQLLNPVLTRVAFPVLARRGRDETALRRGYGEMTRLIALVTFPMLAAVVVVAPNLVPVVFGDQWRESVPLFQILAGVGAIKAIANPIGAVLLARDRPDIGFKINVVWLVVLAGALRLAVESGVVAVAWTFLAASVVAQALWPLILRRIIGLGPRAYVQPLLRPVADAAAVAAAALVAVALVPTSAGDVVALAAASVSAAGVFVLLVALTERAYVRELWALLRGRTPAVEWRSAAAHG